MIFSSGKYLVKMCWIEPNEWLILFNRHKDMIMRTCCFRAYSTKERVKKQRKPKEVVHPAGCQVVAPEVLHENIQCKSEPTNNDEIIKEIIEKSNKEKESKTSAVAPSEVPRKYKVISNYLIQNIMDFPMLKPADFDDCNIGEITSESVNNFPSISTILNETRSIKERCLLEKWKKKMIVQLGHTEFYNQQAGKMSRGHQFHSYLKKRFLGEDYKKLEISDNVKGCLESLSNIFDDLSDVKLVESNVYHPLLHYKGIIDCVALYKNEWHVIEWKVGETLKKSLESTYTAPVQTCAYMGTLSWCKKLDVTEPVSKALVIYAFADGSPAQVFPINASNSEIFWTQWLMRLQKFWASRSSVSQGSDVDEQSVDHSETSAFRDP